MTRFALATGGTAGHIYPAIAVAAELAKEGADVVFLGTRHGREQELLGERLQALPGRPFQRTSISGKALALLAIAPAIIAARRELRKQRIDGVIGFGGFASVGPILAARTLGLWTAILEPNAVLGMANRLLAPFADRIYTGALTQLESAKAMRTGLPVRSEIVDAAARRTEGSRPRVLRFDPELPIDVDAEVIDARGEVAGAYATCDIVVCRGGAGTLAEAAICGVPLVVVPLRSAAEDHQTRNARVYAERGAAVVVDERERDRGAEVKRLLADAGARRMLAHRIRAFAMPDAARDLAADAITSAAGAPQC